MAATAVVGAASRSRLLLHHHRLPQVPAGGGGSLRVGALGAGRDWRRRVRVGVRVFARYSSQPQDFSSRLQDRAGELPKLVEDLLQTSISTGPRGAFRMAQGIQALLGVGGEWLNDFSKVAIIKDINESMLEEVDFRKEAVNMEAFQRYIEAMGFDRQAKSPFVYQHCSTKRVLTMERLYGVPLTDLDSIRSLVPDPELTLVTALNVWFGSLISCESFHADVHAGNLWLLRDGRVGFIDFGIVGRISPRTWAAMEIFLASFATEDYNAMASALSEMGATGNDIDVDSFAKDLQNIFSSLQELDTEIIVAAARSSDAAAVSANVVVDERQMNALFLDLVRVSESYGLKFPREFALLMKQLLYFDRYTRLLAPSMNMLRDERINITSNKHTRRMN
ncbi:uncharacterized aarF domain-containing protein kinase At5g05200, chloroplastic-like [Triticum dicoccoides]|uniref:uncharacterized aarF domain-containing protein kinase At5g05200, chloroplastic-like n=1 Tax=Triticum dicoccoides TaxID=85692 RepID=UPI0018912D63|nr:uncharacterized aarF domain-containing protein kinase At5g05200, chloroplastic-like [Triticum dicoccoides]